VDASVTWLPGGRSRYSDLKEAAPAVRHLCILNGPQLLIRWAHAVIDACVCPIGAWGLRNRVAKKRPVATSSLVGGGLIRP
jgi:hypothetical protein